MRPFVLLASSLFVLATAACADQGDDSEVAGESSNLTKSSGSCAISREQILGSVSAARRAAITRGFKWLDDNVPYSQSAQHEGYRTDCSGFVSMCWEAGSPGETTASFPGSGKVTMLSSYDELVPGDALDAPGHHVVLFLGWNDAAKSGICVLEQASTASDMQFRVRSTSSLKGEYKPMRAKKFAGDTAVNDGPSLADPNDDTAPTPKPTPKPSPDPSANPPQDPSSFPDPGPSTDRGGACVAMTAQQACSAAFARSGTECGTISDGCGGSVSCDSVPGLGCLAGETCSANQCKPTQAACVPKSAADACGAAAAASGIECGMVGDGCGGQINCDRVPSFGCSGGATCSKANRCVKSDNSPAVSPNDPDSTAKNDPSASEKNLGGNEAALGEPGDESGDKQPTPKSDKEPAPKKTKASAGCSAAPNPASSTGGTWLLGLGLALVWRLRRRRDVA
jgi:MYXO-CTERM domain-containing protein